MWFNPSFEEVHCGLDVVSDVSSCPYNWLSKRKYSFQFSSQSQCFSEVLNSHTRVKPAAEEMRSVFLKLSMTLNNSSFVSTTFPVKRPGWNRGIGVTVTAAVRWLRLPASHNDRCSPQVLIWTAASELMGTDEAKLIFPGMKLIYHN